MVVELLTMFLSRMPEAFVMAVGAGMIRNIGGFAENALADGDLDDYEIKKLVGTVAKYFVFILLLSLNFNIEYATMIAFGMDYVKGVAVKVSKT